MEESKIIFSEEQYHFLKDSLIFRGLDTQLTKRIIIKDELENPVILNEY